jgi:hypothetical protein
MTKAKTIPAVSSPGVIRKAKARCEKVCQGDAVHRENR